MRGRAGGHAIRRDACFTQWSARLNSTDTSPQAIPATATFNSSPTDRSTWPRCGVIVWCTPTPRTTRSPVTDATRHGTSAS